MQHQAEELLTEREPGQLATDAVPVRTMTGADADAVAAIDELLIGRPRHEFFRRKIEVALREPGVKLSLVAELDGRPVGFLMASVDYGEFGKLEPAAVLDAVGVHPDFRGKLVGTALLRQLVMNLRALNIERVRTEVAWQQWELMGFFQRSGFQPAPRLCLEAEIESMPRELGG